jgi:hypothetical protein
MGITVSPHAIVYSNRRLARRPRPPDSVVHMAGLDIAVGSVLRLAECPSGCGCDMGWLAANESAAASQKLVFLARQSNHALSLSILESSRSETSRLADYAARCQRTLRIPCPHAGRQDATSARESPRVAPIARQSMALVVLSNLSFVLVAPSQKRACRSGVLANCNRQQSRVA